MKKNYIKKGVQQKQKGGFFPILSTLAKAVLLLVTG